MIGLVLYLKTLLVILLVIFPFLLTHFFWNHPNQQVGVSRRIHPTYPTPKKNPTVPPVPLWKSASHGWCCEGWPRKGEKIRGLSFFLEDSATIFGYMKWRCTHVDGEENFRKSHQLRARSSLYSITYRVFIHPSAGLTINRSIRGYVPLLVVECLHTDADNIHLMIFPLFPLILGPSTVDDAWNRRGLKWGNF